MAAIHRDARPPLRVGPITTWAVALLVALELTLRVCAPALPPAAVWPVPELQAKSDQMRLVRSASVVFIGSSLVDVGVDPAVFDAQVPAGRPAYNAALLSGSLGELSGWLRMFVVPSLHPSTVVIGVSGRELNARDPELDNGDRAFPALAEVRRVLGTETWRQRLARDARASYLVRYRSMLRQPTQLVRPIGHPDPSVDLSSLGWETTEAARPFAAFDPVLLARFGHIQDYTFSPARLAQLGDLLDYLHRQAIQAVVVDMPVTTAWIDLHPRGLADYVAYTSSLRAAAAQAGASFIEGGTWPTTLFADPIHLNRAGTVRLTTLISSLVAQHR